METEESIRQEKIKGVLKFMGLKSREDVASFINDLSESVDGLSENNKSLREAFREKLSKEPIQPSCHPEELKKWIHFVWREMREQNNTVPDDVLDFIKEASLKAIK